MEPKKEPTREPTKPENAGTENPDGWYQPYEAQEPVENEADNEEPANKNFVPPEEDTKEITKAFKQNASDAESAKVSSEKVKAFIPEKAHPFILTLLKDNKVYQALPVPEKAELVRDKLPCKRDPNVGLNIWKLLKDNIGKDLSRIAMPVYLNDPISMLQKVAEHNEFANFLRLANNCSDRFMRLAYIMCFFYAINPYSIDRLKKPFNPLLGETYEFIDKDLHFISEQVSHHPPISAFYCESDDFIYEGYFNFKTTISLSGFMVTPKGPFKIYLKKTKEYFTMKRQKTSLHNFMIGKMYIWHYGDAIITNENSKDQLIINYKAKGWTSTHDYECDGKIIDMDGKEQMKLIGKWNEHLTIDYQGKTTEIFRCAKLPAESDQMYFFSKYQMNLNNLAPAMVGDLPPTDTRLRPDQRAYEYGDLELATSEKFRLEENQRVRRKELEKLGKPWKPYWFHQLTDKNKEPVFQYNGKYFPSREMKVWPKNIPNLFN